VKLSVPYSNLAAVSAGSVAITQIAGKPVSIKNIGWSAKVSTATARFDSAPLLSYLRANGLTKRPVNVVVSGTSTTGSWSFSSTGSVSTK